jgi:hypothetical protein
VNWAAQAQQVQRGAGERSGTGERSSSGQRQSRRDSDSGFLQDRRAGLLRAAKPKQATGSSGRPAARKSGAHPGHKLRRDQTAPRGRAASGQPPPGMPE